jgi:hypothetical protein
MGGSSIVDVLVSSGIHIIHRNLEGVAGAIERICGAVTIGLSVSIKDVFKRPCARKY